MNRVGVDHTDRIAVRTDKVWKTFSQTAEEVHAIRDLSLVIDRGEFVALAGPSGSGKTTLLNLMGGLTLPTSGAVWVAGRDLTQLSMAELARIRLTDVGFVFQAYNLLPVLTALENAEFPLLLRGIKKDEREQRVRKLFSRAGLAGLESRLPGKLSGGQQQRVAVIRAIVGEPSLVLADEPTANLDSSTSDGLLEMMQEFNREFKTTFIFATHDHRVMARANRLIHLVDGSIEIDKQH